jgi:hypothetical protein
MSYNDPDRPPPEAETKESVIDYFMRYGCPREQADNLWKLMPKPVFPQDLDDFL